MNKRKDANIYVRGARGENTQEVGPFIEEADARLCRAALSLYAPERIWTVHEHEPRRR